MANAEFPAGTLAVVREGQGYWDVTDYPYGGCFRRASCAFGVRVDGPGGKYPARERLCNAAGRKLVVSIDGLVDVEGVQRG